MDGLCLLCFCSCIFTVCTWGASRKCSVKYFVRKNKCAPEAMLLVDCDINNSIVSIIYYEFAPGTILHKA